MGWWPRRQQQPAVETGEAEEFLMAFYAEENIGGNLGVRLEHVREEISETGTYTHTLPELTWAARAAWRHAGRCVGRYSWKTLRVRDRRSVSAPPEVAAEVAEHLAEATNGGRIRSMITVFAPDRPGKPGPRIWNGQAVSYAGYREPDGIFGDPAGAGLTDLAVRLGWQPGGTPFDVLPLIIGDGEHGPGIFQLPREVVREVPITHPDYPWFAGLGLRWYAVPMISDMYLEAGGVRYPCAPFNGWYQASTEVGVRDLGDPQRYNMLPVIASKMGLDLSSVSTLWPDEAAVQLAKAVAHSYKAAGVMATDHQTEAHRFMRFAEAEEAAGRPWCADWSWITPPIGGSTTPVFHRSYPDRILRPGFFRHEAAAPASCPVTGAAARHPAPIPA